MTVISFFAAYLFSGPFMGPLDSGGFANAERADIRGIHIVHHPLDLADILIREEREANAARRAAAKARAAQKREERRILEATRRRIERSSDNRILKGLLDLPRLPETAPIDGCAKINTGLTLGGGFMVFTCEKLRPSVAIARHEPVAYSYTQTLVKMGWRQQGPKKGDETKFTLTDEYGCKRQLSQRVWTDRSMNEPAYGKDDRDAYRQIVFLLNYSGKPCQRYYSLVKSLAQ